MYFFQYQKLYSKRLSFKLKVMISKNFYLNKKIVICNEAICYIYISKYFIFIHNLIVE
jgi:hypothetical protein